VITGDGVAVNREGPKRGGMTGGSVHTGVSGETETAAFGRMRSELRAIAINRQLPLYTRMTFRFTSPYA